MKKAALIFVVALLVLSLAACGGRREVSEGETDRPAAENGSGGSFNGGNTNGSSGSAGAGEGILGDDTLGGAMGDPDTQKPDDSDVRRRDRDIGMTSFEQMLDNARVHDTDGFLNDGENSTW